VTIVDRIKPDLIVRLASELGFASDEDDLNTTTITVSYGGTVRYNASYVDDEGKTMAEFNQTDFEDPGFTFEDNHDTHQSSNTTAGVQTVTEADFTEMVSNRTLTEMKIECDRSRYNCKIKYGGGVYVGGLGEAGYLLAPHQDYEDLPDPEPDANGRTTTIRPRDEEHPTNFSKAGEFIIEYMKVDESGNYQVANRTLVVLCHPGSTTGCPSASKRLGTVASAALGLFVLLIILGIACMNRAKISNACKKSDPTAQLAGVTTENLAFVAPTLPSAAAVNAIKSNTKPKPNQPAAPPPEPWFHGTIDRAQAESRLRSTGQVSGAYLVRSKLSKDDGEHVLSLLVPAKVVHYVIYVPASTSDSITIQGKAVNVPWATTLRDLIVHLQTDPSGMISEKLQHLAPIPSHSDDLLDAAAEGDTSSPLTLNQRVYKMLTEEPDRYSINATYFGHSTGVYYRVFYPADRLKPLVIYTRHAKGGGSAAMLPSDKFEVVKYGSRQAQQLARNVPLYVRLNEDALNEHLTTGKQKGGVAWVVWFRVDFRINTLYNMENAVRCLTLFGTCLFTFRW
jgi:hypothetical protein